MRGIVKVVVRVFLRKGEEVAIERHLSRIPVDKEAHKGVQHSVLWLLRWEKQPLMGSLSLSTIDLNLLSWTRAWNGLDWFQTIFLRRMESANWEWNLTPAYTHTDSTKKSVRFRDIFNPFLLCLLLKRLGKEIVSKMLTFPKKLQLCLDLICIQTLIESS